MTKSTASKVTMIAFASAFVLASANVAMAGKVKCYGISKAGQNDCANSAGTHSCAGQSSIDYDGGEWKIVKSSEECVSANGQLKPFKGVNADINS